MLCSRANAVPSTSHHANQTAFPWKQNSEGSGLCTSHNRETEQRKLDGTFPLGGGQPQTGKALQVYGVRLRFIAVVGCCCGRWKQLRPWEDQLSVFILLTIGKHMEVSGKIRESISVFTLQECETHTPAKATGDEAYEMEIVFTFGQIFHLHQSRHV